MEAEAGSSGRLVYGFHSVGAEEVGEHSWRNSDCCGLSYTARHLPHRMVLQRAYYDPKRRGACDALLEASANKGARLARLISQLSYNSTDMECLHKSRGCELR